MTCSCVIFIIQDEQFKGDADDSNDLSIIYISRCLDSALAVKWLINLQLYIYTISQIKKVL